MSSPLSAACTDGTTISNVMYVLMRPFGVLVSVFDCCSCVLCGVDSLGES